MFLCNVGKQFTSWPRIPEVSSVVLETAHIFFIFPALTSCVCHLHTCFVCVFATGKLLSPMQFLFKFMNDT